VEKGHFRRETLISVCSRGDGSNANLSRSGKKLKVEYQQKKKSNFFLRGKKGTSDGGMLYLSKSRRGKL